MKNYIMKLFNRKEVITVSICGLIGVLGIGLALKISSFTGLSFHELSRDPLSMVKASPWTGFFSNMGIFLWGVSFVTLYVSWFYSLYRDKMKVGRTINLAFGSIGLVMYLDDYLMLHESFLPIYFGWDEKVLPIFYFLSTVFFIIFYWRKLYGRGMLLLLGSCFFLGISAIVDTLFYQQHVIWEYYLEDGTKFIGIALWTGFALYRTNYVFRRLIGIKEMG